MISVDKLGQIFIKNIKSRETGYGLMISETGMELFDPTPEHIGKSIKEVYSKNQSVLSLFEKTIKGKMGTAICYIGDTVDIHNKTVKLLASYLCPIPNLS